MGSDVLGVNYTKFYTPAIGSFMGAEWRGKVRAIYDYYEAASLGTGSTIKVGKAMKDEVFLIGFIVADDLSSAGTLILGDSSDPDRFLEATVFTTAGQITTCARIGTGADLGMGYKFTADTDILLTTAIEEMSGTIATLILLGCPN